MQTPSKSASARPTTLSEVKKYGIFCGHIAAGEYVAFWVSHDKKRRHGVGIHSSPNLEACEKETRRYLDNPFINKEGLQHLREDGYFEYCLIVADEEYPCCV